MFVSTNLTHILQNNLQRTIMAENTQKKLETQQTKSYLEDDLLSM